jgi:ABC-type bacteriocin/lantibiotic exporter with double-glycine peptidase domain
VTEHEGPSQQQIAGALASNAASKPINLVATVVAFVVVLAVGAPVLVAVLVAMVVYAGAAARTMFDPAEAERVTAAEQARTARRRSERKP